MTTSPETTATEPGEAKREFSQAKRDKLAKTPKAMNDGSYPIENVGDLRNAISAYGRADEEKRPALRAHIVRNAKRLNATNMLPKNWTETPASEKKEVDAFTAGVLLALAGFESEDPLSLELKAGPPGATFPSPDPGATKLRKYWTRGPGAAKIRWGSDGDFDRCVTQLRKHVGERAKGLCNIYHRSALKAPPGKGHKSEVDDVETKQLWVPDSSAPGGWRANEPAWALAPEIKEVSVDNRTDDDVMSSLDKYEEMTGSVEEAYEQAIADDIAWDLAPKGDLVDPGESDGGAAGDEGAPGQSLFGDMEDED